MSKTINKKKSGAGFIALASVLIIGALILVIGVSVVITSTREINMNKMDKDSKQTLALVNSCAEIGIIKLKENNEYQGRERITVDEHFCNIFAVSAIEGGKTFDAVARVEETEKKAAVRVMDDSSFSITPY